MILRRYIGIEMAIFDMVRSIDEGELDGHVVDVVVV